MSTPLDVGTKLVRSDAWSESEGEKPPYRELIGCLLCLSVATRPNIAHVASSLSQFNDCFNKTHWNATKETIHLRLFLLKLGESGNKSIKLLVDNYCEQRLASNPVYHVRTKHIDIRHHFVREIVESRKIVLEHVASDNMPADVLTKALIKPKHKQRIRFLGLLKIPI